jgi:hypothetical protein
MPRMVDCVRLNNSKHYLLWLGKEFSLFGCCLLTDCFFPIDWCTLELAIDGCRRQESKRWNRFPHALFSSGSISHAQVLYGGILLLKLLHNAMVQGHLFSTLCSSQLLPPD